MLRNAQRRRVWNWESVVRRLLCVSEWVFVSLKRFYGWESEERDKRHRQIQSEASRTRLITTCCIHVFFDCFFSYVRMKCVSNTANTRTSLWNLVWFKIHNHVEVQFVNSWLLLFVSGPSDPKHRYLKSKTGPLIWIQRLFFRRVWDKIIICMLWVFTHKKEVKRLY